MAEYECDNCGGYTRLHTRSRENYDSYVDEHPWNDSTQVVECLSCGERWTV